MIEITADADDKALAYKSNRDKEMLRILEKWESEHCGGKGKQTARGAGSAGATGAGLTAKGGRRPQILVPTVLFRPTHQCLFRCKNRLFEMKNALAYVHDHGAGHSKFTIRRRRPEKKKQKIHALAHDLLREEMLIRK